MANRFEGVDEVVGDAVTIVLSQRADGQWATVVCPKSAHESLSRMGGSSRWRPRTPFPAPSGLRISSRSPSLSRIRTASGKTNGANSTEMTASDGRTHRRAKRLERAAAGRARHREEAEGRRGDPGMVERPTLFRIASLRSQ